MFMLCIFMIEYLTIEFYCCVCFFLNMVHLVVLGWQMFMSDLIFAGGVRVGISGVVDDSSSGLRSIPDASQEECDLTPENFVRRSLE